MRTDGALKLPLDAMGTNLLACEVGGRGGGFDRRHDNFRDALMREARRASYSTKREFAFGVGDGMAAAHEALLRGAAAVGTADAGASLSPEDRSEVDYAAAQAAVAAAMRAPAMFGTPCAAAGFPGMNPSAVRWCSICA